MPGISSELSCLSIRIRNYGIAIRSLHHVRKLYRFLPVPVVCGSELRVRLRPLQSDGKYWRFAGMKFTNSLQAVLRSYLLGQTLRRFAGRG